MKKTLCVLFAALILFAAVSCKARGEFDPPAGWQAASDEKADFYFYVPEKWTVDYSTAAAGAYFSASDPSSVSVMAWELPNTDSTVEEWWELNREEQEKVFSGFTLESEESLALTKDNLNAKKYVYSADLGGYSYRFMQVAALKGTSVYLFTYASVPENFDAHLEEVNQMLGFLIIK